MEQTCLKTWGSNNRVRRFPEPIQNLIATFCRLPGVGPKTALRYVFTLLKQPKSDLEVMARAVRDLERIRVCERCFTYAETTLCEICADTRRDSTILCVVEEPRDIATIESTDNYRGFYHVLGGTLAPMDGITPEVLRVRELLDRLTEGHGVLEIVLALSPTVHGEMTILYLAKQLASRNVKITRLARGLPLGATIEYADDVTLGEAIKGRRNV